MVPFTCWFFYTEGRTIPYNIFHWCYTWSYFVGISNTCCFHFDLEYGIWALQTFSKWIVSKVLRGYWNYWFIYSFFDLCDLWHNPNCGWAAACCLHKPRTVANVPLGMFTQAQDALVRCREQCWHSHIIGTAQYNVPKLAGLGEEAEGGRVVWGRGGVRVWPIDLILNPTSTPTPGRTIPIQAS